MENYSFEIHTYAPELNKIFYKGVDVTKTFGNTAKRLDKDYKKSVHFVRSMMPNSDFIDILYYEVKKEYASPAYKSYNNIFRGYVIDRKELIKYRNMLLKNCIKGERCKITMKRIYKY